MSNLTDQINLFVNINGNNAKNQLNELRKKAVDLAYEMKNNLKKGTQEYIDAAGKLKQVNSSMSELKKTIGITALSMKELNSEKNRLVSLRNSVSPLTKEWKNYDNQLQKVIGRQREITSSSKSFRSISIGFSGIGKSIGILAGGYLGFSAIVGTLSKTVTGAVKLGDQLADLRRVAGLTKDEANGLNKSLLDLDTRTSGEGLRNIAIVAGKLGVAKGDILSFTSAVDKLVVSLGDELGDADQITTQLGKILNVFDGKVTGDNISHLGNAIIELANAGVASGPFIVDFTQRVSGIAKASGISLGATVGLAAGFEELGLRSESSATALQKLLSSIAGDLPKAAKIAGVPFKEFNTLFADKPQEALIKYAEGLTKNKKSFSEIVGSFKDAGEEGARVVQTLQAIGQNGEFLRGKIDIGATSIKNLNAQEDAFAIKNETLAGSIDRLGKVFDRFVANEKVTSFLKGVVNSLSAVVEGIGVAINSFRTLDEVKKDIATKRANDLDSFVTNVSSTMDGKTLEEQQKLANSYKSIYISSRQSLAEFLQSSDKNNKEKREQLIAQTEQDGRIFIATQKKLNESIAQSKKAGNLKNSDNPIKPNFDKKTGPSSKTDDYASIKKDAANFYKELQKLKEDAANSDRSIDEKELIALEKKYADLHSRALEYFKKNISSRKEYGEQEKIIIEAFNKELASLQKKQFDKINEDKYSTAIQDTKDHFDEEKNIAGRSYADGKLSKEQYNAELHALDIQEKLQLIQIAEKYSSSVKKAGEDVTKLKKDFEKQQIEDAISGAETRTKIAEDEAEARKNKAIARIEEIRGYIQQFQDAMGSLNEWITNNENKQLARDRKVNNEKKNNLKKQLDGKLFSQAQYEKKVEAIDKEQAKKEADARKKQANRDKALRIFDVIINTATAVAKTFANFGFPLGVPFAAVMAAIGAAQIGAIASTPVPEMGKGGLLNRGPYHRDKEKGLQVIDPRTGQTEMFLEKDEAVINGNSIRDSSVYTVSGTPSQIASKLNSIHGGIGWSTGAILTPKFRDPAPRINSNMPRIMAQGGLIRPIRTSDPNHIDSYEKMLIAQGTMIEEVQKMRKDIKNQNSELHAVVSIKEFRRKEKVYDNARKSSGMNQ